MQRRYYTKFFAVFPRRMTSGSWVFLGWYYITPDPNGQGVLLSHREYLEEIACVEL